MPEKAPPPENKANEVIEKLRRYGKEAKKNLFSPKERNFDERELVSGSADLLEKSDAELFPDETEEYKPSEKKPRIVIDNGAKKE